MSFNTQILNDPNTVVLGYGIKIGYEYTHITKIVEDRPFALAVPICGVSKSRTYRLASDKDRDFIMQNRVVSTILKNAAVRAARSQSFPICEKCASRAEKIVNGVDPS